MKILLLVPMILFAWTASADSPKWFGEPNADLNSREVTTLSKGGAAHFENDDATTDSKVLNTSQCDPAIFHFNPDEDGALTGAEVILWCLDGRDTTTTANNGRKVLPDTDGDGLENDVTFDGSTGRTSIPYLCDHTLVETSVNGTPDEFRATVECR